MNQNQEAGSAEGDPSAQVTLRRKPRHFTARENRRVVKEVLRSGSRLEELCRREASAR